jgi:hypothetical protein
MICKENHKESSAMFALIQLRDENICITLKKIYFHKSRYKFSSIIRSVGLARGGGIVCKM